MSRPLEQFKNSSLFRPANQRERCKAKDNYITREKRLIDTVRPRDMALNQWHCQEWKKY